MALYAIYPSHGCYSQSEAVSPVSTHTSRREALYEAERLTEEHRNGFPGMTSGSCRVVALEDGDVRNPKGHDLNKYPSSVEGFTTYGKVMGQSEVRRSLREATDDLKSCQEQFVDSDCYCDRTVVVVVDGWLETLDGQAIMSSGGSRGVRAE